MSNYVVDPELVAQLRLHTRPPGKKPTCLDLLNDEQLNEVYHMLASGAKQWTNIAIARHIQQNYMEISSDDNWVADCVSKLSQEVLGPRRGLAKLGPVSPDEKRIRDRWRKHEERARKQLSTSVEIGKLLFAIQDEIAYWTDRGIQRGEPYEKYLNDLLRTFGYLTTVRDEHMIKAGLMRPPASQLDINVRQAYTFIDQNVEDKSNFVGVLSSMKRELESIAEPVEVQKLIPEKTDEIQLLREDDQGGEGSDYADGDEFKEESEPSGTEDH